MLMRDVYPQHQESRRMPVATSPARQHTAVKLFYYVSGALVTSVQIHVTKLSATLRIARLIEDTPQVLKVVEALVILVTALLAAAVWLSALAAASS